jgi:hypothetical protein
MTLLTSVRGVHPLTNPNNYLESVFIAKSQSVTGKSLSPEGKRERKMRNGDVLQNTIQV